MVPTGIDYAQSARRPAMRFPTSRTQQPHNHRLAMRRKLPWLFAAIAYFGAPAWAYFALQAARNAQQSAYGLVKCGTPMVGIILLACLISGASSLIALGVDFAACRKLPDPHAKLRPLEIGALSFPLVVATLMAVYIFWA